MKITIETTVNAPLARVWESWTTPADIMAWNAASDDWHTTLSTVDLREGGTFSSRMEARDGSQGFDFHGVYTRVEPMRLIEAMMGERALLVEFSQVEGGVSVRETFDAEEENAVEMQKAGWQAILDNFKRHTEV
uniref:SRPBCC domain-containing protein n=1 Tax=Yoonia sp. TaxID=2212373 RepID=UPI004048A9D6|tara:strand:+ start:30931 stop:31332 length:402 start_codon:yes stop_codon:yes gene_type:complete